jgi:hypothetical protein
MLELDADHRRHAVCELAIRDLKHGSGLADLPSDQFNAWLLAATLAHNLLRWTATLGLGVGDQLVVAKTLRRTLLHLPGRLTHGLPSPLRTRGNSTTRASAAPYSSHASRVAHRARTTPPVVGGRRATVTQRLRPASENTWRWPPRCSLQRQPLSALRCSASSCTRRLPWSPSRDSYRLRHGGGHDQGFMQQVA